MNYREKPIPALNTTKSALDYHNIPVDRDHMLYEEPLVDLNNLGIAAESFYSRDDQLNFPYCEKIPGALKSVWCRESYAKRLLAVNESLKPYGVELLAIDGYRPVSLQRYFWDLFYNKAKAELANPTDEACTAVAGRFWSDPRNFNPNDTTTWPTHATGGAVDLVLRKLGSEEQLYMGGVYDDVSDVSHTRYYEALPETGSLTHQLARQHRRLLYWAMVEQGFANYHYEWWHFDYGTQMWAMNRALLEGEDRELVGWYGPAPHPEKS